MLWMIMEVYAIEAYTYFLNKKWIEMEILRQYYVLDILHMTIYYYYNVINNLIISRCEVRNVFISKIFQETGAYEAIYER